MKKMILLPAIALVVCGTAYAAGMVSGTIKSVDASNSKLEVVVSNTETKWVPYTPSTEWPVGVTDPAALKDKAVDITTNGANEAALVELVESNE